MAAAATCGALLAAWGADVIKIEPPWGDRGRDAGAAAKTLESGARVNPRFELHNRGKRSLAVDLATLAGRDLVLRLVDRADAFVTNALPRVLERFGLTHAGLAQRNASLVYGQITGYGLGGPDENRASFDHGAFWAQSGLASYFGAGLPGPPQPSGGMGDRVAGALLAGAVAAALAGRTVDGKGAHVSTSLLRTGIWMQGSVFSDELLRGSARPPDRHHSSMPTLNWFRTADDELLYLQVMSPEADWKRLVDALDHPALDSGSFGGGSRAELSARAPDVVHALDEAFAARPLAEWSARLDAAGICWEPVLEHDAVLTGDRARDAGAFVATGREDLPMAVADPVDIGPPRSLVPFAPTTGADTDAILLELGVSPSEAAALRADGVVGTLETSRG
jgi:crotonobetainyl-CoA:carnitine CoA-transferase CaiB-like acyl-CoA transferase